MDDPKPAECAVDVTATLADVLSVVEELARAAETNPRRLVEVTSLTFVHLVRDPLRRVVEHRSHHG